MINKSKYIDLTGVACKSISFVGDIHGEFGVIRNNCRLYPDTIQFYCGDVGMGFYKPEYYNTEFKKINTRAKKYNCMIVLIRGNHDDPMYFYNNIDGWDASVFSNIWMAQDWQVFGTKFGNILCSGGAVSVDRDFRIEGKNWWALEKIDYQPIEEIFNNLKDINIDIIATHTAPQSFPPFGNKALLMNWMNTEIIKSCEYERGYLDDLREYIESHYDKMIWFYGHFHNHHFHNTGKTMAYGLGINEVKEVAFSNGD